MNERTGPTRRELFATAAAAAVVTRGTLGKVLAGAQDAPASKTALPRVKPEDVGIDPKQLKVAYDLMEKWTTGKDAPVPGGAILAGRNGKVVEPRFFGRQGPEADAGPLRRDA